MVDGGWARAMQAARLMHMRPGGHVNSAGVENRNGCMAEIGVVVKIRG